MVEELMRFIPLNGGSGLPGVAQVDISFGDTTVHSGDTVFASTIAANRDAAAFDRPEEFNPFRE